MVNSEKILEEWEITFEAPSDWSDERKAAHAASFKSEKERRRTLAKDSKKLNLV